MQGEAGIPTGTELNVDLGGNCYSGLEHRIVRRGLELGFTNVGFAALRDYPEVLEEASRRPNYGIFTQGDDSLLARLARAKTLNPWADSVVCATLGYAGVDYPENLLASVARTYLSRAYTPQPGTAHAFRIEELARFLEGEGMRVDAAQFRVPQRIACAEAGIVSFGRNNFAYTRQDGSFVILVTMLVDAKLKTIGERAGDECPSGCRRCIDACPTGAIVEPYKLDLHKCILFNNQRFEPGAQEEIWDAMGERIHGCDACQAACPRNRAVLEKATAKDPFLELLSKEFDLERILALDDAYYEAVVRPVMYNYIKDRNVFRRNAAVALGNTGDARHVPALRKARQAAEEPSVLRAIDWAIAKLEREGA